MNVAGGRRVVVVDNDPEALDLAVTDLRLEGHDIVGTATNGDDAVRLCAELEPEVLVVDYRMAPGPNGAEVAHRVLARQPELRVVVYSNYDSPEVRRAVRQAGARFLVKGDLRALRRAVRQ